MTASVSGSTRKNLRRAGTVSAGTLALVLSGGGMAFAGLLPSPTDAALGTVTGAVTGSTAGSPTDAVVAPLTGTLSATVAAVSGATGSTTPSTGPLPVPTPTLPAPLDSTVNTLTQGAAPVTGALSPVTDALKTVTDPLSNQLPPNLLPDNPVTGGTGSHTGPTTQALTRSPALPTTHSAASAGAVSSPTDFTLPAGTYDLSHWTAPSASDLGLLPSVATMPELPAAQQAQLAAGVTPQMAAGDRIGIPHSGSTGGLPGIAIILATIAVGVVAAGHVAIFQQRLIAIPTAS